MKNWFNEDVTNIEKELQTNVHIQQSGNPDYMVEEDSSEPEVEQI